MRAEKFAQFSGRQEKGVIAYELPHFPADCRQKPDTLILKARYVGQRF